MPLRQSGYEIARTIVYLGTIDVPVTGSTIARGIKSQGTATELPALEGEGGNGVVPAVEDFVIENVLTLPDHIEPTSE